jgi:alkanesulfonate monooxygenase SsuD/methylene tetrahydromethanopterin reductase-like flavin-dependent oxidoreductase (luciferase family)
VNIDKPKIGVLLPTRGLLLGGDQPANAERILRMAERVEAAGLDSVWVGDSLVAKPRLEPLAALGAIAARTSRVRLGTAVLLPALRHPVLLAQTMATVDLISGGRLIIGAGVGGAFNDEQRGEWKAAGVDPTRRARRFEEIVEVVKGLGPGEPYDFKGRHFEFDAVTMRPSTTQPGGIPVLMATHYRAGRPAQIDRAARLSDGIIAISDTPDEFSQVIAQVEAKAAELGRDPANFDQTFYLTVNVDSDLDRGRRDAEDFLTAYYGAEIWGTRWGPFGGTERVAERMAEYAAAGARTLVVRLATYDPERQLDVFLEKVAPHFT